MTIESDLALVETCLRLNNLNEFKPFREYLDTELQRVTSALIECQDDRQVAVLQGEARALKDIKMLIERSPDEADRIRTRAAQASGFRRTPVPSTGAFRS